MPDTTPEPVNRQDGVPIGDGQTDAGEAVATGDRREEMRYEDDPAQLARVRHTSVHPDHLPKQMTASGDHEAPPGADAVTDVAEPPPSPSVWDARPPGG
ncbi:hypothetical protein ACFODL_07270 [Phenylobacterium terrae]|uniref:Uncharacterized protein n=1 Tax=Phenylobacterium terrae TaxID=2665495 RepID=A0ABW4N6X6_9CAUL